MGSRAESSAFDDPPCHHHTFIHLSAERQSVTGATWQCYFRERVPLRCCVVLCQHRFVHTACCFTLLFGMLQRCLLPGQRQHRGNIQEMPSRVEASLWSCLESWVGSRVEVSVSRLQRLLRLHLINVSVPASAPAPQQEIVNKIRTGPFQTPSSALGQNDSQTQAVSGRTPPVGSHWNYSRGVLHQQGKKKFSGNLQILSLILL